MTRKHDFYLPFAYVATADVHAHLTQLGDGSQYAIDGIEIIETRASGEKIRWAIEVDTFNRGKDSEHAHVFMRGEDIED